MTTTTLLDKVEDFAEDHMKTYDRSHDFFHVDRVVTRSIQIARSELARDPTLKLDMDLIRLAALMHDVNDREVRQCHCPVDIVTSREPWM
jgi:HD superfamily phosphodiesterase